MVFIQSLTLIGLSIAFFIGQLWRLSIGSISFPAIDVFIVIFAVINVLQHPKPKNRMLLLFLIYTWINLFINYFIHGFPLLSAAFYLIRLSCILSFFIFPPSIDTNFKKLFSLVITANIVFGLIQYFFWPDLTYFKAIGWDDHLSRLVSTYLDPTFTGLIYLLFLIQLFLSKNRSSYTKALLIASMIALALTYSRSTFLSLVVCSLFVSIKLKNVKYFLLGSIIIAITIFLLPRPPGEGTKLERTSSVNAKMVNFKEALQLFKTSPIIGYGYNNLPSIKNNSNLTLHSSSGFDVSIMTLLTTTGLVGLMIFLFGFYFLFRSSSLTTQTMIVAIFIHSLFANSLLYPFTLIFLILI